MTTQNRTQEELKKMNDYESMELYDEYLDRKEEQGKKPIPYGKWVYRKRIEITDKEDSPFWREYYSGLIHPKHYPNDDYFKYKVITHKWELENTNLYGKNSYYGKLKEEVSNDKNK